MKRRKGPGRKLSRRIPHTLVFRAREVDDNKGEPVKAPGEGKTKYELLHHPFTAAETRAKIKQGKLLEVFRRKCESLLKPFRHEGKPPRGDEFDHYLRSAVIASASQPPEAWLVAMLVERLGRGLTVDERRWHAVKQALDGLPWDAAYERASELLKDDAEAAGGPDSMKRSYQKIERELRREGRGRPRTYRRRPPR